MIIPEQYPELQLALIGADQFMWLHRQGVSATLLASLTPMFVASGHGSAGSFFEPGIGASYILFEEPEDIIFWQPKTDELLRFSRMSFALNEQAIGNAATYSLDANLNIFSSVLDWLRADRDGIVVVDWELAFDRLRDAPRIAVCESLLSKYRKWMHPRRMPILAVLPTSERQAA